MTLNQFIKTAAVAATMFAITGITNDAHAQLGKKLKAKLEAAASGQSTGGGAKDAGEGYAEDFSDDKGISGAYTALDGVEFENAMGAKRKQKNLKIRFTEREGDKFVNKLEMFYTKAGDKYDFIINDKETKKLGATTYRITEYHSVWLIELEKGVLMAVNNSSTHQESIEGTEKVTDVFAKDPAKLEVYDLETAQAKFDQLMSAGKSKQDEKLRTRLMEYEAYKQNVGKVVFVDSYKVFNYNYTDEPSEDPKNFIKTRDMGDALYFGAYFEEKITTSCGADCQLNMVYEMNGKTADRVALRNSNSKWNNMIKAKTRVDKFCYNSGHQLISPSENIIDYAFMYVLFQNKDQFKEGQTYKLNVKLYSNRDGNNEKQIAEGTINLVYKKALMDKWMKMFQEWYDE